MAATKGGTLRNAAAAADDVAVAPGKIAPKVPEVSRPGSVSGNPANRLVETGTPLKDGSGWVRRWTKMTAEEELAQAQAIENRYNQVIAEAEKLPLKRQQRYILEQMQQFRSQYRQQFLQNRGK